MRDILEGRLLLCENKSSQLVSQSYCALELLFEASMFNFGIARHNFSCQTIKCLLKVDEVEKEIPLVLQIYIYFFYQAVTVTDLLPCGLHGKKSVCSPPSNYHEWC